MSDSGSPPAPRATLTVSGIDQVRASIERLLGTPTGRRLPAPAFGSSLPDTLARTATEAAEAERNAREMVEAAGGVWPEMDFSEVEVRILAQAASMHLPSAETREAVERYLDSLQHRGAILDDPGFRVIPPTPEDIQAGQLRVEVPEAPPPLPRVTFNPETVERLTAQLSEPSPMFSAVLSADWGAAPAEDVRFPLDSARFQPEPARANESPGDRVIREGIDRIRAIGREPAPGVLRAEDVATVIRDDGPPLWPDMPTDPARRRVVFRATFDDGQGGIIFASEAGENAADLLPAEEVAEMSRMFDAGHASMFAREVDAVRLGQTETVQAAGSRAIVYKLECGRRVVNRGIPFGPPAPPRPRRRALRV